MKKMQIIVVMALMAMACTLPGHALPLSHYAGHSVLATGNWVKIAIPETGMYEITREELAQMGFNDPQRVQVFGRGGIMMDEELTVLQPDDLTQVPILCLEDKICFYAIGTVNLNLQGGTIPHFSRTRNTYSQQSYYFLTEGKETALAPSERDYQTVPNPRYLTTSYAATLHEQELVSVAFTGSELLGEDLLNKRELPFTLVNPTGTNLAVTSHVSAKIVRINDKVRASVYGMFNCKLNMGGSRFNVPYSDTGRRIAGCLSEYFFYQSNANPDDNVAMVELDEDLSDNGSLDYSFTLMPADSALLQLARLDYFIVTYQQLNRLSGNAGAQCPIAMVKTSRSDVIQVEGASSAMVWDVSDPKWPVKMGVQGIAGRDGVQFTPGNSDDLRKFVAFNPEETLLKIGGYQLVENQDLHGQAVPHMLIVTNRELMVQADRVAQMHRDVDGMDVLVVNQDQVFNEFSGGTPDAMGLRMMCKMFYDRNATKFKYLLLFGNVSYDNRGITTGKTNRVISYIAPVSHYEDGGYINDDFFGYLLDQHGVKLTAERLCIGVGHMPVANSIEASQAVDKLLEYVYSTDYGPWRNNYSLWAENSAFKEEGPLRVVAENYLTYQLHESQAAGIGYIIDNDANAQMVSDMAFVGMFPQDPAEAYKDEKKQSSNEAKRHIQEMLSDGQYFATYVGHSGSTMLTSTRMWTSTDVLDNTYYRLPIMTTAGCDLARIDSDHRGICELMFHKRYGGAIALYTTTRQVQSTMNDQLNRAFVTEMFSYNRTGQMPRLGDAYMASKNSYGDKANLNKFHFLLLGDPALQINYPKPLFKISAINSVQLTGSEDIGVAPLHKLTVEAKVMNEKSPTQVNTKFNGDATITIYDSERTCMKYIRGTGTYSGELHSLPYPREKLVQVQGRVVNGVFRGTVVMPRFGRGDNNDLLLSIYAHEDGTDQMVNGIYRKLHKLPYDASEAVQDNVCPVIEAMFLNDELEFSANATVGPEATLYVRASDNMAFNTQQQGLGQGMRLVLDGGKKSYNLAKNLTTVTDEGRTMAITMPISGLTAGRHSLELTLNDVCGNTATQTISFVVNTSKDLAIAASDVASATNVQIDLTNYALRQTPTMALRITDINGNIVRSEQVSTFPYTWDLTNKQGVKVPPGLYRIYGNYTSDEGYGGTNLINFVVLPPVKQN